MNNLPLFLTSTVGSLPRPATVRDLLKQTHHTSTTRHEQFLDAAVGFAVSLQEQAGLDIVTDGEWRRKSYLGVIADLCNGFELTSHPHDGRPLTTVVSRLSPRNPGFVAKEVEFLRSIASKQVKSTLPSPTLLGERLWDPVHSVTAYPTRQDFVRDCVPVLQQELRRVEDAGADIIQIDDPHLCLFVDPKVRSRYSDPQNAATFAVEMNNAILDGLRNAKLSVHLCRRAGARARGEMAFEGGYSVILDHINALNVHQITLEYSRPGSGQMEVLGNLRPDLEIGLGCVDVTPGQIDSVSQIMARVQEALKFVDASRLSLNPDCGFAPGSAAIVDLDEVYSKLCNQVEAARMLRVELGGGNP